MVLNRHRAGVKVIQRVKAQARRRTVTSDGPAFQALSRNDDQVLGPELHPDPIPLHPDDVVQIGQFTFR